MTSPQGKTVVVENARLELLRVMAWYRDWHRKQVAEAATPFDAACWGDDWVPLFAGEPKNSREDIRLALRECVAIGHMETTNPKSPEDQMMDNLQGPPVRITDAGYDWIRAHDLLGEEKQDARSVRS